MSSYRSEKYYFKHLKWSVGKSWRNMLLGSTMRKRKISKPFRHSCSHLIRNEGIIWAPHFNIPRVCLHQKIDSIINHFSLIVIYLTVYSMQHLYEKREVHQHIIYLRVSGVSKHLPKVNGQLLREHKGGNLSSLKFS